MTVDELLRRFPQIPKDLAGEPVLERMAERFDSLLRAAQEPSPCTQDHTPAHRAFLKLIGPMSIYGFGLQSKEKLVQELTTLVDTHGDAPEGILEE